MRLVENIPLDTHAIADLIVNRYDLYLVWPFARYPFDHEQWKKILDPELGNKPFLVFEGSHAIGHVALCITDNPLIYSVSFLYLLPHMRSKGLGRMVVSLVEGYARERLSAKELILVVRTYNPAAINCYERSGFEEKIRDGTLIRMSKSLAAK